MKLGLVFFLGCLLFLGTSFICSGLFEESAYIGCLIRTKGQFPLLTDPSPSQVLSDWVGNAQLTGIFGRLFNVFCSENITGNLVLSHRLFTTRLTDLSNVGWFYTLTLLATVIDGALARTEALQNDGDYSPNGYSIALHLSPIGLAGAFATLTIPTPWAVPLAHTLILFSFVLTWIAVRNFHRFGH